MERKTLSWIILLITIIVSLPLFLLIINEVFHLILLYPKTIRAISRIIDFSTIGSIFAGIICSINGIKLLKTKNKKLAITNIIVGLFFFILGISIFFGKITAGA